MIMATFIILKFDPKNLQKLAEVINCTKFDEDRTKKCGLFSNGQFFIVSCFSHRFNNLYEKHDYSQCFDFLS